MTKFPLFLSLLLLGVPSVQALDSVLWSDRVASNDESIRKAALQDLRGLNPVEKKQAAKILGSLLHRGPVQAERAAWGLAVLGPDAEPALGDLLYALSYDEESTAVAISSAIVPMGQGAVGPLRRTLEDPNFFIRRRVAEILGRIGPRAASAVDGLAACLGDTQYEVQTAAEKAIARIGAAGIPELMHVYSKSDEAMRRRLVQLLGPFGEASVSSLMNIAKKDPSGYVRLTAMEELSQMQPFPQQALPVLVHGLSDLDESVRGGTADLLAGLGPQAQTAAPLLKKLSANDPDMLVRQKAESALAVVVSTTTPKK